jgi:hypothetical protein
MFDKDQINNPQWKKMTCLIVIFEAFWYAFHQFVVFTDHNIVTFIKKMQNKNHR